MRELRFGNSFDLGWFTSIQSLNLSNKAEEVLSANTMPGSHVKRSRSSEKTNTTNNLPYSPRNHFFSFKKKFRQLLISNSNSNWENNKNLQEILELRKEKLETTLMLVFTNQINFILSFGFGFWYHSFWSTKPHFSILQFFHIFIKFIISFCNFIKRMQKI